MHVCMYDKGTLNPHRVVEGHLGLATIPTSTTILAQAAVGGASTLASAKIWWRLGAASALGYWTPAIWLQHAVV